jgi:hypothetical protein
MNVNKARSDNSPAAINRPPRSYSSEFAHRRNAVGRYRHVRHLPRRSAAIDDYPARKNNVKQVNLD